MLAHRNRQRLACAHGFNQRAQSFAQLTSFDQIAENRKAAIERQTRREQRGEFAGELDKLVLADFLLREERQRLPRGADGSLAGCSDAQRNATHFAQAHDYATLGVGLHYAVDDFAGLVGRAILKERHDFLRTCSKRSRVKSPWRYSDA